jgi:hypothetical protein
MPPNMMQDIACLSNRYPAGSIIHSMMPPATHRCTHNDLPTEAAQYRRWGSTLGPLFALEPLLTDGLSRLLEPAGLVITIHPELLQEDECWVAAASTPGHIVESALGQQPVTGPAIATSLQQQEQQQSQDPGHSQLLHQEKGFAAVQMLKLLVLDTWPKEPQPITNSRHQGRGSRASGAEVAAVYIVSDPGASQPFTTLIR